MRLITDNRRHFLEIQLNREIHKFYPMLISIWTQRDICSKCLWQLPPLSQTLPLGQCSIYSPDSTRRGPPSYADLSLVIVTHLITLRSFKKTGLAQVICRYNLHESIWEFNRSYCYKGHTGWWHTGTVMLLCFCLMGDPLQLWFQTENFLFYQKELNIFFSIPGKRQRTQAQYTETGGKRALRER